MTTPFNGSLPLGDCLLKVGIDPARNREAALTITSDDPHSSATATLDQAHLSALIRMLRDALHKLGR